MTVVRAMAYLGVFSGLLAVSSLQGAAPRRGIRGTPAIPRNAGNSVPWHAFAEFAFPRYAFAESTFAKHAFPGLAVAGYAFPNFTFPGISFPRTAFPRLASPFG